MRLRHPGRSGAGLAYEIGNDRYDADRDESWAKNPSEGLAHPVAPADCIGPVHATRNEVDHQPKGGSHSNQDQAATHGCIVPALGRARVAVRQVCPP